MTPETLNRKLANLARWEVSTAPLPPLATSSFILFIDNEQDFYNVTCAFAMLANGDRIKVIQQVRRFVALICHTSELWAKWHIFMDSYLDDGSNATLLLFNVNVEMVADHIIQREKERVAYV